VQSLDHTVWVTLEQENFHLLYFMPNGSVKTADYKNIVREEGIPYGWENTKMPFSLAGNQVGWGENSGTLFPEVMLVNDVWYMHFPVNEDQGESSLYGTLWTYKSSGYPGILVFDTNSSFTRILLSSVILLQVSRGTYSLEGNVLTMKLDGKQEECTLGADSFTFFERTYEFFE